MSCTWIDTHCHLDAPEFATDRFAVIAAAYQQGVRRMVIPAVQVANFQTVAHLAASFAGGAYALGIHPLYTPHAPTQDIARLRQALERALPDPRCVAVGEIGMDFFVPALTTPEARARQEWFYVEQLKLAREFELPVLLHVRRSQDQLLKYLRKIPVPGGIAHAFNGSHQQARAFIDLGFKLGFGGALTYARALQIRRLASEMPAENIVLETDAPDIPPSWLQEQPEPRNRPGELPRIAQTLAGLRGWTIAETAVQTSQNALQALPRLSVDSEPAQ